jgi:fatty-acid peroxygenase
LPCASAVQVGPAEARHFDAVGYGSGTMIGRDHEEPQMTAPELSVQLLRRGYEALTSNVRELGQDRSYLARMLGRRALVVWGAEGARLFYDDTLVQRAGAVPPPLARLLFGKGAVHGLDGEAHLLRKAVFLEVLEPSRVGELADGVCRALSQRVLGWPSRGEVSVFTELVEVYGSSVLRWAGIELSEEESRRRSHELARIVDGFGGAGYAYARAAVARRRSNRWAAGLIGRVRRGDLQPPRDSALWVLALGQGAELDEATAGIELLNILRPTVGVAWLGTFAALALDLFPEWRARLVADEEGARHRFAQEVRRTAPFAPALAARVRARIERFGVRVLDVLSTNHDPRRWPDPVRFDPTRFQDGDPGPYDLVAQGGGDPRSGHKCPGEPLATAILRETAGCLAAVDYTVVSDPSYDPRRIPTLPTDGLRVRANP